MQQAVVRSQCQRRVHRPCLSFRRSARRRASPQHRRRCRRRPPLWCVSSRTCDVGSAISTRGLPRTCGCTCFIHVSFHFSVFEVMTCHRRTNPYRPRLLVQVGKHVTMEDHGNTVFCCAFSHDIVEGLDGKAVDLATASYDGTTRVWDLAKCAGNHSKKCRRILKGNPGGVWCCAYTHDSRFLVTGCSKGSICVYSAPQRYDLVGRQDSSHGPNAVFACSTGVQVRVCMSVCMCPPAHSGSCRHA